MLSANATERGRVSDRNETLESDDLPLPEGEGRVRTRDAGGITDDSAWNGEGSDAPGGARVAADASLWVSIKWFDAYIGESISSGNPAVSRMTIRFLTFSIAKMSTPIGLEEDAEF